MKKMSKKIKNMLSILFVAVLTVSAFCIPASAAEDNLTISISTDEKDSVTAKVGDTVKYAIYMTDTKEEVIGAAMSFFYNDEYLKLNADSINCESFKNAIGNPKLKNFYTFTWTDVQNPVKLNGDKALVSAEFKVLKGGNAVPIVNNDTANSEKIQGDFVNYIDGMGEENSPNKDDHKSVVVEKKYISTQQNSQVVDVTKVVESSANGSGSNTTLIIIIAIVVVLIAAGAIIFVKKKDEKKNKAEDNNAMSDDADADK